MPFFPSLIDAEEGPHGEEETGSPEEEVRDALAFYRDVADEPGEVVLPIPSEGPTAFAETAAELGAAWQLPTDLGGDGDPNGVAVAHPRGAAVRTEAP